MLEAAIARLNALTEPVSKFVTFRAAWIDRIVSTASGLTVLLAFFPDTIKDTGGIALDILWFLLFLPIFAKVFQLRLAAALMRFRKSVGVLMGMLATVHTATYFLMEGSFRPWRADFWTYEGVPTFLAFGLFAFVFTFLMLVTSNTASMRFMGGKNWKLLHRTAYAVAVFTVIHVSLLEWVSDGHPYVPGTVLLIAYFVGKGFEWAGKRVGTGRSGARSAEKILFES